MHAHLRAAWRVAAGLCLSATVAAQPPVRPDPLDPRASVPPARHDSVLQRYRGGGEVQVGDWKAANDNVTRIGGWRSYLRQAAQPETPASAAGGAHEHHRKP